LHLELHAELPGDELRELDVETCRLLPLIDEAEGRHIDRHSDPYDAGVEDLFEVGGCWVWGCDPEHGGDHRCG